MLVLLCEIFTIEIVVSTVRWIVHWNWRGCCRPRRFDVVVRYYVIFRPLNRTRYRFVALLTIAVEFRIDYVLIVRFIYIFLRVLAII